MPADLNDPALISRIRLNDMLLTQREVQSAMMERMAHPDEPGVMLTKDGISNIIPARPIPNRELWFEKVWKGYNARRQK